MCKRTEENEAVAKKRSPIPVGKWFVMKLHVAKLSGIVIPEPFKQKTELTGKEEFEVILVGPDCKHVKIGHRIRPHGIVGHMEVDGEHYWIGNETPEPPNFSCHLGIPGEA
jgi:hypothetical protein